MTRLEQRLRAVVAGLGLDPDNPVDQAEAGRRITIVYPDYASYTFDGEPGSGDPIIKVRVPAGRR